MIKPPVIINFVNKTNNKSQLLNAINLIGLEIELKSAKSIFIKPNLTCPVFRKGVTTRVEFVKALVNVLSIINQS